MWSSIKCTEYANYYINTIDGIGIVIMVLLQERLLIGKLHLKTTNIFMHNPSYSYHSSAINLKTEMSEHTMLLMKTCGYCIFFSD